MPFSVGDARPPVCSGERLSACHEVGKGKAAPQIGAGSASSSGGQCWAAQKKGLFPLSWLPAVPCLGRALCSIAASFALQAAGRPVVFSLRSGCSGQSENAPNSAQPWHAPRVDPELSSISCPLRSLCRWPRAIYPATCNRSCAFLPRHACQGSKAALVCPLP